MSNQSEDNNCNKNTSQKFLTKYSGTEKQALFLCVSVYVGGGKEGSEWGKVVLV